MRPPTPPRKRLLDLARKKGILRLRDVTSLGIHPEYVRRLCDEGELFRVARGLYSLPDLDPTENHTLAEAIRRVPKGVICLLSALRFHTLGSQNPSAVWLAIGVKARSPVVSSLPLRIVRFSGRALTEGIVRHRIEGVDVAVYEAAKTVADCFKYRRKIGLDVALEALRDGLHRRKFTREQALYYASICRVGRVILPYLQAME